MDTTAFSLYQTTLERIRMVAAARALLLERGLAAVELPDVALALRVPIAAVERQFPEGKPALVRASLEAHMHEVHTRLLAQRHECSNAVEELLAMRRLLVQLMEDTRRLFVQELTALPAGIGHDLQRLRRTFTLDYLAENLRRGIREGYYRADLPVEAQAQQWLSQADAVTQAARSSAELADEQHALFERYLTGVATPLGAFVGRRLQETPPYY